MARIGLWFYGTKRPELHKTCFSHALLDGQRIALRGDGDTAATDYAYFRWTPSLRALVVFLLEQAISDAVHGDQNGSPAFSGDKGSLAASLDYALGKQPGWLHAIFGWDEDGNTLARRIISRLNPERKRKGPVVLLLNSAEMSTAEIDVYQDGQRLTCEDEFRRLLVALGAQCSTSSSKSRSSSDCDGVSENQSFCRFSGVQQEFRRLLFDEAIVELRKTDIFTRRGSHKMLSSMCSNPRFRKLVGPSVEPMMQMNTDLHGLESLGLNSDELKMRKALTPDQPIRIAMPAAPIGAIAIFRYLKEVKGYNIELNYRFAYAIQVMKAVLEGTFSELPDAIVLAVAPTGTFLAHGNPEYRPHMFLPKVSHRVVGRNDGAELKTMDKGSFMFLRDDPSSASFYFDTLEQAGMLNDRRTSIEHLEPHEVVSALREGDEQSKAILIFPYCEFNRVFNNCSYLDDSEMADNNNEVVLFLSDSFAERVNVVRCLEIAIRDAWLALRENPTRLQSVIDDSVADESYMTFLSRCGGLHDIPGLEVNKSGT